MCGLCVYTDYRSVEINNWVLVVIYTVYIESAIGMLSKIMIIIDFNETFS